MPVYMAPDLQRAFETLAMVEENNTNDEVCCEVHVDNDQFYSGFVLTTPTKNKRSVFITGGKDDACGRNWVTVISGDGSFPTCDEDDYANMARWSSPDRAATHAVNYLVHGR